MIQICVCVLGGGGGVGIGPGKYMGLPTKAQCPFKKPNPGHVKEVDFRPYHSKPSPKAWVMGPKDKQSGKSSDGW